MPEGVAVEIGGHVVVMTPADARAWLAAHPDSREWEGPGDHDPATCPRCKMAAPVGDKARRPGRNKMRQPEADK